MALVELLGHIRYRIDDVSGDPQWRAEIQDGELETAVPINDAGIRFYVSRWRLFHRL